MSGNAIDCQEAATYLGVSVKTIRRWAQEGKLHGKKVGSRGDWRFSHAELDKMIHTNHGRYDTIAAFLHKNAAKISEVAGRRHQERLGIYVDRWKIVKKSQGLHTEIIQLLAKNLNDVEQGKLAFENISKKVAGVSLERGLTIEETIDGVMYLKQAVWACLEETDLLLKLITTDLYSLSRTISTYNDIIASQIAFAYHHEHAKGQEELKNSEEKFYRLFRYGPTAKSIIHFPTGKWVDVNNEFQQLTGYSREELVGKDMLDLNMLPEAKPDIGVIERRARLKKTGRLLPFYLTIKTKTGELKRLRGESVMVKINGEDHAVTTHLDVTEKAKWEQALQEREDRYRTLFESIDDGFCIVEMLYNKKGRAYDYRFVEVNSIFRDIAQMNDPVGKTLKEMVPSAPMKWTKIFEEVASTGKSNRTVDYSESRQRWYDIYSARVGGPDSRLVAQLFSDVTTQRRAENEIKSAAQKVINTLESMSEAFMQLDKNWNIVLLNEAFVHMSRQSRKELLSHNVWEVLEEGPRLQKLYQDKLRRVMRDGKPITFEDHNAEFDLWFQIRAYSVDGGVSIFMRDITEEKHADEKRAQFSQLSAEHDQLIQLTKAKDEFIGIASHQLRTPATAVKQYIGIMLAGMAGSLTDSQQRFLETAYHSNERQLKLINDLLKTAQIDAAAFTLHRSQQNIASLLSITIGALTPTFESREQQLVFTDDSHGAHADVDPIEMDLVFSNLLDNASKYSPANSTITANVRKADNALEIRITDEGVGISKRDQMKIFDKFTRISNELSATVSGTGLGLYWVKHIVELHGGTITVDSKPGKGSCFTVRLPL